jgi:hypothetical protein
VPRSVRRCRPDHGSLCGYQPARVLEIVVNQSDDARAKLPHWLDSEWLEPIIDSGECIGTLVLIPDALRRKATAFRGGLPRYKLRRAVEFVDANLDRVIHLKDMANVADVSLYHFHRQFKKTTGLTRMRVKPRPSGQGRKARRP